MPAMRSLLLPLLLCLSLASPGNAQSPSPAATASPHLQVLRDIPYVPNAGPHQRLDLYLPAPSASPHPLVVYIHGGAWQTGSKSQSPVRRLLPYGYAAASIDYRLSQDAPFPAQIQDCKAAIRFLRANAAKYDIDPAHIGVWGASAGGHLVALLGVTGTNSAFDTGPNLDQSSAVQCVIDFFGPADFLHYGDPPRTDLDTPGSAVDQLLGGSVAAHPDAARAASPIYYITRTAAPFLIFQGDADPLVPLQQSEELDAALKKDGVESTLHILPGAGHGGPAFNTPATASQILAFLNRHLY
jgi:acetyl esterase/lipase